MSQFLCCTLQSTKGSGEPIWLNVDLITAIEVDQFGLGSKISLAGGPSSQFVVQEKPHEIFEKRPVSARATPRP